MVLIESRFKAWPGELSSEAIAHWKRAVKSAWVAAARSIVGWPMMRPGVLAVSRSEEHTSELQSLMRISYAVFCLKKKKIYVQEDKKHSTTDNTVIICLTITNRL